MSKKLIIIIGAAALVVVILMGGAFYLLWTKMAAYDQLLKPAAEQETAVAAEEGKKSAGVGPLLPLDTMIVNLADKGGKRYLRVTINLEVKDEKRIEEVKNRMPQIKDSILTLFPTKYVDEINSAEGKTRLRDDLLAKLNGFFKEPSILTIYFTEFVIQ